MNNFKTSLGHKYHLNRLAATATFSTQIGHVGLLAVISESVSLCLHDSASSCFVHIVSGLRLDTKEICDSNQKSSMLLFKDNNTGTIFLCENIVFLSHADFGDD